jgi:haloacetate dehalogenase
VFEGFERRRVETEGVAINLVHGGEGPPVLLLHGYPQSHVEWHKLAPILARRFTVVAPDLRGYGDSDKPMPAAPDDLSLYCKRAMAQDQVQVMAALGHEAFHVVGHDRGARVGHRMALDHAESVLSFTSLDVVASEAAFEAMDCDMAFSWFHWNLMRQPAPLPETLIANSVALYLDFLLDTWCGTEGAITDAARGEYLRCFSDPDCIRATCLDYRAITLDLEHDAADRGHKIRAPMLVLWASEMARRPGWQTGRSLDILESWRERAESVDGRALACGHFLPEELPEETAAEIGAFIDRIKTG